MTKTRKPAEQMIVTRWITVLMPRHAAFGGGEIEADLPDTREHRAMYPGKIVREWMQKVAA